MLDFIESDIAKNAYCIENNEYLRVLFEMCQKSALLSCTNSAGAVGFDMHADHDDMVNLC